MLIDWFTVTAQMVNFLILVALLKYFFYDRVVDAMETREALIQERMEAAGEKEKDAREEARSYREKKQELEERRDEMLKEAEFSAEEKRKTLMKEAREDVESLREKWREGVRREKEAFVRSFRQLAGRQAVTIAENAIRDLADLDAESLVVERFLTRIGELKKEDRRKMADSMEENRIAVRSGFELSTTQRQRLTRKVHEIIAAEADVHYEEDPELLMGVDLKTTSKTLSWNLDAYLKSLQQTVLEEMQRFDAHGGEKDAEASQEEASKEER